MGNKPENKSEDYAFCYADIDVIVSVKVGSANALTNLTANQRQVLSFIIRLALDVFIYTHALYTLDEQKGKDDNNEH